MGRKKIKLKYKFFENALKEKQRIEKAIKKYGHAPEHNFWWYQAQTDQKSKNVFFECENDKGLLTIEQKSKKRSYVFSSPLSSPSYQKEIIIAYLDCVFQFREIQRVTLELENLLYKDFVKNMPREMKARKINYTLTWPVYDLKNFDISLSGNLWKSLRKTRKKFYQNHSVVVLNAKKYKDKKSLHSIIDEWRKKRGGHDRADFRSYHNFIKLNFKGATEARVFIVDGKACGINAGWLIPNSNRFYGALGIHNYSFSGLGDVLYLEDLIWLKKHGYKEVDMGGGEDNLTYFKSKFHPKSYYKTYVFSVVKS